MSTLFNGDIFAGLSGLEMTEDSFDLGEGIVLCKTYAHLFAPFMVAFSLAQAGWHHPGPWKATSGGFAFDITAELVIPADIESRFGSKIDIARILLFLLRIGVNPAITLPVFSNHSFSDMQQVADNDARLLPFEVQPRSFPLGINGGMATEDTTTWVKERWQVTHRLANDSTEFALAIEAIDNGQFIQNTALTFVSLWGTLEALFSPSTAELRFRVSSLLAAFLEVPGERRESRQKELVKLYDKRSAAAHGKPKHQPKHLLETFNLVREVLIKIIDRGNVTSIHDLNAMLFGSA